jgi:hypothetical protein
LNETLHHPPRFSKGTIASIGFSHGLDPKRTLFRTRSDTLGLMTKLRLMRRVWCYRELRLSW